MTLNKFRSLFLSKTTFCLKISDERAQQTSTIITRDPNYTWGYTDYGNLDSIF